MFECIIDNIKDAFRQAIGKEEPPHVPEKGMRWQVFHERKYPHYARGLRDPLSRVQVVGVDEQRIEVLNNVSVCTMSRDEWQDYYEANLRRARSAERTPGKGSIVPYYEGIKPVQESFVESLKNPPALQPWY